MKKIKSHVRYSKRQRSGILFLSLIIVSLQLVYFFVDFSSAETIKTDSIEIQQFQDQIDSLKLVKQNISSQKIYPFNPNYLTDFKAYQLGLSVDEIDKIFAYRKKGKFVNSAKQFQEITGINDSLLTEISPYFKFPEWINKQQKSKSIKIVGKDILIKKDLNSVTKKQLQRINGIGEKLAQRIISYRELLQGYSFDKQLYEVYYLNEEIANKVLACFEVKDKPTIKKLNVNLASFKDILHLPYIDYNLTKKIVNFRYETGKITSLDHLKLIDSFPIEKYDIIALYLTAQ